MARFTMTRLSANDDARAFLTLIALPTSADREAVARALAKAARMDLHTLRLRLRPEPPVILGRFPKFQADVAMNVVAGLGGDAFAPTLGDLAALGPSLKLKNLTISNGTLVLEQWRGPTVHLQPDQIQILVRAQLSEVAPLPPPPPPSQALGNVLRRRIYGAFGIGGSYGVATAFAMHYLTDAVWADEPSTFSGVREPRFTSWRLDMHTADRRVFQIDAGKFAFAALGDQRGHSDAMNIDRFCDLIVHLSPDVIVDPYFPLWRAPPGHTQLRLPHMRISQDDPSFAFYSRWAALLYRHIVEGSAFELGRREPA